MTAMLEAALEYARRGIPVFPVKPKGKTTVTDHGFKDATTDEKTIRGWWKKWLNANIGLYPGGAGLVVVDVDGPAGMAFAKKRGWLDIPTPRVITKRGLHLYFRKTSKGVISNAKPHPKIDIRSDNGYVLAPPSVHPSGHVYTWENEELEFAPLPRGVLLPGCPVARMRSLVEGAPRHVHEATSPSDGDAPGPEMIDGSAPCCEGRINALFFMTSSSIVS